MQQNFNHLDNKGHLHMVDIGHKPTTRRKATARGFVRLNQTTLQQVRQETLQKGNLLSAARMAGIMAAKRTSDYIPLCHPILLSHVHIDLDIQTAGIEILATCETVHGTGVEMEALCAVSHCALTIYDMCKVQQKDISIEHIQLLEKQGGKSGNWQRHESKKQP